MWKELMREYIEDRTEPRNKARRRQEGKKIKKVKGRK
jgi:hypothetical protein